MNQEKVAILIFANSANQEANLKPFKASRALFEGLNQHITEVVQKTGIPFFHYSEALQTGHTFGERFSNAITSIYEKGYSTVISVGNDTPHLKPKHLLDAVENLKKTDMVLGPSTDGGFYLMGLKQSVFHKASFIELPWQTLDLQRSLSEIIRAKNLKVLYFEALKDLDTASDITSILHDHRRLSLTLKRLLQDTLNLSKNTTLYHSPIYNHFYTQLTYNKGSPCTF